MGWQEATGEGIADGWGGAFEGIIITPDRAGSLPPVVLLTVRADVLASGTARLQPAPTVLNVRTNRDHHVIRLLSLDRGVERAEVHAFGPLVDALDFGLEHVPPLEFDQIAAFIDLEAVHAGDSMTTLLGGGDLSDLLRFSNLEGTGIMSISAELMAHVAQAAHARNGWTYLV